MTWWLPAEDGQPAPPGRVTVTNAMRCWEWVVRFPLRSMGPSSGWAWTRLVIVERPEGIGCAVVGRIWRADESRPG